LLLFNALAIIICGVLQINNLYLLFGCRFFQGVVVGNYMGIIPIYIK
jgi:MFS family permease